MTVTVTSVTPPRIELPATGGVWVAPRSVPLSLELLLVQIFSDVTVSFSFGSGAAPFALVLRNGEGDRVAVQFSEARLSLSLSATIVGI